MFRRLINKHEYKCFEIYAVIIKISMTENHNFITLAHACFFYHYSLWGKMSIVFLVACICSPFEAPDSAFEVHFLLQGFIFTPYHILVVQGHAAQICLMFFKVETLLNSAFNLCVMIITLHEIMNE